MLTVSYFCKMKNNTVFLLLDGESPNKLPDFSNYSLICATDGAYKFLQENQITPHFVSGDFDDTFYISDEIEIIQTPDQNFTDFDKILQLLFDKGFKNIHVFGASGKEQDHFLGNLHTAICWKNKLEITFFDNHGTYFLAKNQSIISDCLHKTISLIPIPKVTGISTFGLQYPLKSENLVFGERIGTRNKAVENEVEIRFETGELFIFINQ